MWSVTHDVRSYQGQRSILSDQQSFGKLKRQDYHEGPFSDKHILIKLI
jgi:hypothetical protein